MAKSSKGLPSFGERTAKLEDIRARKMAQSAHRFVRGSTEQFYQWLASEPVSGVPDGPPVWICGDCHVGNLGPVSDASGRVRIHIRDLDQTVIGNPAHDLIRLALSLASAARGSDLPGVTTALMLEAIMDGYSSAFDHDFDEEKDSPEAPDAVRVAMRQASKRAWKHLAKERLEDTRPTIPLGKKYWPLTPQERDAIATLIEDESISRLVTMVKGREDGANVELVDAAYWVKGCSSLGLLRYAVLVEISGKGKARGELCLVDIKEAVESTAPVSIGSELPGDPGHRVVEGALHISPFLGDRMRAASLMGSSVFIRELMPQDLKLEMEELSVDEALRAAEFLASVVGYAHARQMDRNTRKSWQNELAHDHSRDLAAPSWLWTNVVGLLVDHERTYLEHCRRYALASPTR
jgi:uncharacterized protein (DUF2252 family)